MAFMPPWSLKPSWGSPKYARDCAQKSSVIELKEPPAPTSTGRGEEGRAVVAGQVFAAPAAHPGSNGPWWSYHASQQGPG